MTHPTSPKSKDYYLSLANILDLQGEIELLFTKSGADILEAIESKLVLLEAELMRLALKVQSLAGTELSSEMLDDAFHRRDNISPLMPVSAPQYPEEPWQQVTNTTQEYQNKILVVEAIDMYHNVMEEKVILETIYRNIEPEEEYTLSTAQLLQFGL